MRVSVTCVPFPQVGEREGGKPDMTQLGKARNGATAQVVDLRSDPGANDFDCWYRDHRAHLESYCARFLRDAATAADVAQEALFRAWSRRADFESAAQVRPWLFRVARNLCIDVIRSRQRVVPASVVPDRPSASADPGRRVEAEDDRMTVRAALRGLSPRHRDLLIRREVDGVTYEDLAEELGVTVEGARAVVFRARRCLRHQVEVMTMTEAAVA
jgi:RNA polymerase sigma-70 factor (ECF subfamily)